MEISPLEIPIDNAIERFHEHLNNHDRTILSAKFGDGKSYFLHKLMEDEKLKEEFVFLSIYPINYQVEDNRDVFELIKYDLLIQLFVHKIMVPDFKITNRQAIEWCLQLNAPTLVEGVLPIYASLCLDEVSAKMMAAFLTAHKAVGKIRKKIKEKVNELAEPIRDKQIDQFLKEISKNPVSGLDVITEIIQTGIARYKEEHPEKKLVLIIEDMDRMDPAHLFRILNVFSAHIDYNYRFHSDYGQPVVGNKFGLDKVIFVMWYENTKNIFHHFYGLQTDFIGYINKFCSSNFFTYSFSDEKEKYFYERMAVNTGVDIFTIKYFVKPEDLANHSIREIVNAIEEVDSFVVQTVKPDIRSITKYKIHHGALKVIAILRKLGMKDDKIKERLNNCMRNRDCYKQVFPYLACILQYAKRGSVIGRVHYRDQVSNEVSIVDIERVDEHGKAVCQFYLDNSTRKNVDDEFSIVLDKVLSMVSA